MNRRPDVVGSVSAFIREKKLLSGGETVCVCFSGGADSTALLHIFLALREEYSVSVCACHLHHGIRGEEAYGDAAFCRSLCKEWGVPFFYAEADIPALREKLGCSLEEAGRKARYDWFASLGEREGIDLFATAHQKNDQAETVIQRIIRGTAVEGLAGIPPRRGNVIRPLLSVTRKEIEAYLSENGIACRTDSSNASEEFTRNYIRHTLLPAMEKLNPKVVDAVCRLSVSASEFTEAFDFLEKRLPSEQSEGEELPDAVLKRRFNADYRAASGKTLCAEQSERLLDAVREGNSAPIPLPGGVRAFASSGKVLFRRDASPLPPLEEGILRDGVLLLRGGLIRISFGSDPCAFPQERNEFVYNLSTEFPLRTDGICGMIRYRSRIAGDKLMRFGVNRDVRKMISEKKLPVCLRTVLPVIFDDSGILCVPFVGIADRVYAGEGAKSKWIRVEIDERRAREVSESQ